MKASSPSGSSGLSPVQCCIKVRKDRHGGEHLHSHKFTRDVAMSGRQWARQLASKKISGKFLSLYWKYLCDEVLVPKFVIDPRQGGQRHQKRLDLLLAAGGKLGVASRRRRALAGVQHDRLGDGGGSSVVQIRAGVANAPERRRSPLADRGGASVSASATRGRRSRRPVAGSPTKTV